MANCKICGEPVRGARGCHPARWGGGGGKEEGGVWGDERPAGPGAGGEESLRELHCNDCALVRLLNLGL